MGKENDKNLEINDDTSSEKEENKVTKKKNKLPLIIGLLLVVTIAAIAWVVISAKGRKDTKVQEKLNLAAQYLTDMDYENAIATYEEVLGINPKCPEAYLGLVDVYSAMATDAENKDENDYESILKNYDKAADVLNRALNPELYDSESSKSKGNMTEDNKTIFVAKLDEITLKKTEVQNKWDEYIKEQPKREKEELKQKLLSDDSDLSLAKVGDTVYFGHDGETSLTWKVLEVKDDKVLLLLKGSKGGKDLVKKIDITDSDSLDSIFTKYYFCDEERDKIQKTDIQDTIDIDPYKDTPIVDTSYWREDYLAKAGMGTKPDANNCDAVYTGIEYLEIDKSPYDGQKVYFFPLSYDEALKYNVSNVVLRNYVKRSCEEYIYPKTNAGWNAYKEALEFYGCGSPLSYDPEYGYCLDVYDGDTGVAKIEPNGNVTYESANIDKVSPAMWVSIY